MADQVKSLMLAVGGRSGRARNGWREVKKRTGGAKKTSTPKYSNSGLNLNFSILSV